MSNAIRAVLGFAAGLLLVLSAPADELTTIAGKKHTGKLVAVDAKSVTFAADESKTQFASQDVSVVDLGHKVVAPTAGAKYTEIELIDGSVIRCGKALLKGKAFEVELLPGPDGVPPPTFQLPMTAVFYLLRNADDPRNRDDWKKLLPTRGKRDLYVQRQGDRLDFVQGTVLEGNPAGDTITFEKEGGEKAELRLTRAAGLVFNQVLPADVPPKVCNVLDVFGNIWVVKEVKLTGTGATATTVSGIAVTFPAVAGLARLDYSTGNITYLADLQARVTTPRFQDDEQYRATVRTQPLAGETLRLGKKTFSRGLRVTVPYDEVVIAYDLGGDYKEFKATVGFPSGSTSVITAKRAGMKLTIDADDRALFSEVIRPADAPRPLTLDVKGSKQLRLTIEQLAAQEPGATLLLLDEARVQK
jgi:hypothetical protein